MILHSRARSLMCSSHGEDITIRYRQDFNLIAKTTKKIIMKNILNKIFAVALICLLPQLQAIASSHREAPLISNDPLADNTDLYVFRSPCDSNKIVIIANYIPFEHPAGGPNWYNFGQNIRYEIHIKNKSTGTTDDITYRFTFTQVNQDTTTFFNIRLGKQNGKTLYTCERSLDGGLTWTTIMSNGM